MTVPHPGTREYRNQAIRIMDLTVNTDMLKDLRFENCQICGPAVLILLSGSTVQNCSFGGSDLNEIFWLIPPDRPRVVGGIGVARVEFYSCRCQSIGWAGGEDLHQQMAAGMR